jgi:TolB-like protein
MLAALLLATACSTVDVASRAPVEANARWAVLPFANYTETPQAGSRAASIVEAVLRTHGFTDLQRAPQPSVETLFDASDAQGADKALAWARGAGVRYALTGTVSEWRYKVGVDGEPAVGLTLSLLDVASGKVIWSAAGGRSGWSREALSAVAQKLARDLTAPLVR